ncbi:MAG TPA: NAD(P)-dependent oxidoreductase [Thermoanaerobaculia bacterium]
MAALVARRPVRAGLTFFRSTARGLQYVLGIVGHGNVGSRVARLAHAFGMRAIALDPYVAAPGETERASSLDELLAVADILTCPFRPQTRPAGRSPPARSPP